MDLFRTGVLCRLRSIINGTNRVFFAIWGILRRARDSNSHDLAVGGFQDRCNTIMRALRGVRNEDTKIAEKSTAARLGARSAFSPSHAPAWEGSPPRSASLLTQRRPNT